MWKEKHGEEQKQLNKDNHIVDHRSFVEDTYQSKPLKISSLSRWLEALQAS